MANPILKEDLIANDVQPALDKMLETLGKIDGALTSMRGSLSQHAKGIMDDVNAHQSDAEAMGKYAAKITELEKAISDLTKAQKENANMQSQVHAAKAKSIELSEYEKRHLEELEKRLKLGAVWQERTAQAIDTTNMSYNAMKATLNTLLSTLRSFETESKKNSTEAMALESAVERLRDAMKELDGNTKAVANAEKQMAEESKKAAKEAADAAKEEEKAYQASQKESKARADAAQKIHDARQKEIEDAFKARDAEQQRLKLNDQEFAALNQLKAALASEGQARMDAVQGIDIQKMSYNELYQTYNALKDALNKMTVEDRLNTEAGKKLTEQSLKIRDTINELQKSTGNYTLQVGKYRAAFDGLGYSFQQILREAPSALNINQFFLAISNNIPQFLDQVKAFNEEQKAIKANLATMTEGTQEYAEELGKVMTIGQKLAKTLVSWQSLVLVGLLIVRNWDKIVNLISKITTKTREWAKEVRNLRYEYNELDTKIRDSVRNTNLELDEIMRRLPNLSSGTTEWANAVARVNEMTGSTLTATTATVDEVGKVTQAYKEQIEQLAKNKFVIERIAESVKQSMSLDEAMKNNRSLPAIARILGLSEGSDEYKQFQKRFEQYYDEWSAAPGGRQMGGPGIMRYGMRGTALRKNRYQLDEEFKKYLQDTYFKDILTEKEIESLWDKYYKPLVSGNNSGSGGSKPSEKDITERYWEAERALLNAMEEGVQKEIEISDWERRKNKDEQDKWYAEQLAALEENVKNGFTTREQADKEALELQRQYNALQEDEDRQHNERVVKIQMDAYRKQLAIREELHKKEMQAIVETSKADTVHVQRRVRNATQEANKNAALATNIEHLVEARKKLLAVEIAMDENKSIEERIKLLEQLNKQIERYASQISITQKIRQYGSVSDMLGTFIGGRVGGQGKENLISNILGEDAMKARIAGFQADNPDGWEKDYMDWLDGEFEEWGKQAMSAATTWYSTTMGYINDLISAYVELANAKAEAAAEATEAAQEEYDKEKALLEAGYASRVEATWAEYQEKKAAQEKAEADAKAAAQAQQQLNEAEAMGSLIVASANIWKTFSAIKGFGVPLALAALATMWGSFIQSKVKAAEVSKYGEGGFEVLEGGSHASGHDIDLGVRNRRGRRMRAEGEEGLGIFSRRAMNHYGANNIEAMVNSVNRLEFEGNAAKRMSIERSVGMQILSMPRTDLHRLESGMDKLVSYGARSIHHNPDGTVVETRKNARIVYKNI